MAEPAKPLHVSILVIPDAMTAPITGLYESLQCFGLLSQFDPAVPGEAPFDVELVAASRDVMRLASGLPLIPHRSIDEINGTDIVIVPSMLVHESRWVCGRYPELVAWMRTMHDRGATLCSACSGALLLAETGLLDGLEATIHWAYAPTFEHNFPTVRLRLERVLIVTGERQQLVMSGASGSWHDLVLYIVARFVGPTTAQAVCKFMLLQWHNDGQALYAVFKPPTDHGDATIRSVQDWLGRHYAVANPVEEMVARSGLAERSFKRRFSKATGMSPIAYVQNVRINEAKKRLERTDDPIDEIGWAVGYQDPAFFRRLFKRIVTVTPGHYRRKIKLPEFVSETGQGERLGGKAP